MKTAVTFVAPIALVAAVALFYFLFDARTITWLPHCPFHLLTGLYCPGCGSQRALSSLLHGEFLQATRFNVLLVVCLPLLFYSAIVLVINKTTGNTFIQKIFYSSLFVRVVLIVILVFWVLRNLPVFPFYFLAPQQH